MAKEKSETSRQVGRPSRKDLGLEPTKLVGGRVEIGVFDKCIERFGSLNQALKVALATKIADEAA